MKRKVFLVLVVLLVFGFVSFPCFAQTSGDTQKFVGTWKLITTTNPDYQWILLADGTGNTRWRAWGTSQGGTNDIIYVIPISGKIVISIGGNGSSYEYYFIDGGNTLVLYREGGGIILKKIS